MEKIYEILNKNNRNSYGGAYIDGHKYFFKTADRITLQRELDGLAAVKPYYPTIPSYGIRTIDRTDYLLYEYLDEIDLPGGMLADVLDDTQGTSADIRPIFTMYRNAFEQTLLRTVSHSHDVFFADRIETRIKTFYSDAFISEWTCREVSINGKPVLINLRAVINSLYDYFSNEKNQLCVVSQADPTEYNLATKPLLLDYYAGGYTPVMAEFATFNAITYLFGDYLARKYNPGFYEHRNMDKINEPVLGQGGSIIRSISTTRKQTLEEYVHYALPSEKIMELEPMSIHANDYRHYFVMKALGVFNISLFPQHEIAYILGILQNTFDKAQGCDNLVEITKVLQI